jgi:hypothetical protein
MTLLNKFMPIYDLNEIHSITISASPRRIFKIIKEITPLEIPLFRSLFWVRSLPRRLVDKTAGLFTTPRPVFEQALKSGFLLLAENPNEEFVLGLIGQFWKLRGGSSRKIGDAHEFVNFDTPGYAKATINFRIDRLKDANKLSTETRIYATDPIARRKFAAYWLLIHPGSAFVRRMWLKSIKKRAERGSR